MGNNLSISKVCGDGSNGSENIIGNKIFAIQLNISKINVFEIAQEQPIH